jgi:hypothetical protein
MNLLLRRTWLPTLVFVGLTVAIGIWMMDPPLTAYSALVAVLLTPILWGRFVNRVERGVAGRGAAAGALVLALAQVLPMVILILFSHVVGEYHDGMTNAMDTLELFYVLAVACAAAIAGGASGAILGIRRSKATPSH